MSGRIPVSVIFLCLCLCCETHIVFAQVDSDEQSTAEITNTDHVLKPVPEAIIKSFALDEFYQKCIVINGFPIVSSQAVDDAALMEAAFVVRSMLKERSDVFRQLAANKIRLTVMSTTERTCDVPEHSDLTPKAYWESTRSRIGSNKGTPQCFLRRGKRT